MAGPWEDYTASAAETPGPWDDYQAPKAGLLKKAGEIYKGGAQSYKEAVDAVAPLVLTPLQKFGQGLNAVMGAPKNQMAMAALEGKPILKAGWDQFGSSEGAPTGQDLARKVGISDNPVLSEGAQNVTNKALTFLPNPIGLYWNGLSDAAKAEILNISRSKAAGLAWDVTTDPANLVLPAVGKVAGPASKAAVGKLATPVGQWMRDSAEMSAAKALGFYQRSARQNAGELSQIGRTALDEGVVRGMPTSYEELSQRAADAQEISGQKIGQMVEDLSNHDGVPDFSRKAIMKGAQNQLSVMPGLPGSKAENQAIKGLLDEFGNYGRVTEDLPLRGDAKGYEDLKLHFSKPDTQPVTIDPVSRLNRGNFTNEYHFDNFQDLGPEIAQRKTRGIDADLDRANALGFDQYAEQPKIDMISVKKTGVLPNDAISLKEGRAIKGGLKKKIKWDRIPGTDIPINEQVNRALYSELAQSENDLAGTIAERGVPGAADFVKEKQRYGNLDVAKQVSQLRADKNFANRLVSPSDYGVGALGAVLSPHGDVLTKAATGIASGAFNKLLRLYGNQAVSSAANSTGAMIIKSPQLLNAARADQMLYPMLVEAQLLNQTKDDSQKPITAIDRKMRDLPAPVVPEKKGK